MGNNLTGQLISATYEDLVQISGSSRNFLTDGTGSNITSLDVTASNATNAITASFLLGSIASASFAISASFASTAGTATSASFATSANNVFIDSTSANVNYKLLFAPTSTGSGQPLVDATAAEATYNPSSNVLTVGTVVGNLTGTASLATNATSASFATTASFAQTATAVPGALFTASVSNATVTFTKGDASTFGITVNNVVNATSASIAAQAVNAQTANVAALATTASFALTIANGLNINANTVTASAATFTNLFATSASFGYVQTVTGSAVIIGDAFIILNADTPTLPFAGIKVYDTGSASTASIEWNGNADTWITVEENGDSAMILTGLSGSKGSEAAPAVNKLLKGTGNNTVADSSITDNGTNVSFSTPISGTQITASTGFLGDLIGTASFATSASYALNATTASYALNATSASYALNATSASYALVATSASFATDAATATTASFFSLAAVTQNAVFSGSVRGEVKALTIASNTASMDLSLDNFFTIQLVSGSTTYINPSNILPGQTINLLVDTTGSGLVSFPSSIKQVSGSSYIPTTGSGTLGKDIVTFISFDNTSLFLSNVKNLL